MATEIESRNRPPETATDPAIGQWRGLKRAATLVAVLTSPVAYIWFREAQDWSVAMSLLATVGEIALFRAALDLVLRWFIPWPSLLGSDEEQRKIDMVDRRRAWFWRSAVWWIVIIGALTWFVIAVLGSQALTTLLQVALFLPINFLLFFGPFLMMAVSQISSYEPGDADWGVKLADVRGQAEAKEEVRRVVTLWQSGEAFERAGGKRERGLLMLGAPGTGKTMLSKAIATDFNCPFVSIPGSGFAGMFLGMDAITVRLLARKAKRLARKWGGQCIVFIDEIDAVGMRRSSLGVGTMAPAPPPPSMEELCFFGGNGALTPTGDLILETRAWRERLFAMRAPMAVKSGFMVRLDGLVNQVMPGGMMGGGQLALNQLLVVMDGIGSPRFFRKNITRGLNTLLDAMYIVPQRVGSVPLRLPGPGRLRSRSISSAPATPPSRRSIRHSPARAGWAAMCGSARPRRTIARTSSISTWRRSTTTPTWTVMSGATSWRGSPTATRRR